jgi:hypothetical protein
VNKRELNGLSNGSVNRLMAMVTQTNCGGAGGLGNSTIKIDPFEQRNP